MFPIKFENEESPSNGDIMLPLRGGVSALHESAVGHTGKYITLKLRVQYLKNAQKYLMNQKDMLMSLRNHQTKVKNLLSSEWTRQFEDIDRH